MNTLLPFQKEAVEKISQRKRTLLADEQGLGKTIQAICVLNNWRWKNPTGRTVIVCPAGLRQNWVNELSEWLDQQADIFTVRTTKDIIPGKFDILITSYELINYIGIEVQLKKFKYHTAIFDEVHMLQNGGTKRTQFYLGHFMKNYDRAIGLSGTPMTNSTINLYPVLRAWAPEIITPYLTKLDFGRKYCGAYFDSLNGWIYKGNTHSNELHNKLVNSGFMIRRLKQDVLKELPPRIYQLIGLDPTICDANIYEYQKEIDWDDLHKKINLGKDVNFSMFSNMRRELAFYKLESSYKFITDSLVENKKIVVFAYHREIVKALADKFKPEGAQMVIGGMSDAQKQVAIDNFQNDQKSRIFVAQIKAGGVGITLTSASLVIFVEASWCPADILQAIDRLHRIGQDKPVVAQFLVIQNTIEHFVLSTAIKKIKHIKEVLDDKAN